MGCSCCLKHCLQDHSQTSSRKAALGALCNISMPPLPWASLPGLFLPPVFLPNYFCFLLALPRPSCFPACPPALCGSCWGPCKHGCGAADFQGRELLGSSCSVLVTWIMFWGQKSDFDIGQELPRADLIKCWNCPVSGDVPDSWELRSSVTAFVSLLAFAEQKHEGFLGRWFIGHWFWGYWA